MFNLNSYELKEDIDAHGGYLKGSQKLEAELTLRAGKIEWDLNGIGIKGWTTN